MGSLKKAAKTFNNERWDQAIKDDLFQIPVKPTRVRLYNKITTVKSHWVEFVSKTKGPTGFYELCLNWDPVTDEAVEGGCPMCEDGMKAAEHHFAYLISRAAQKKGLLTIHPVRLTGKLAGNILKLSDVVYGEELPEGWNEDDGVPDATDPKFGFDVVIRKEENNSKVEYHAVQGDKNALTKEERAAFEEYINDGHDVALLAKKGMKPRKEIVEKLANLPGLGSGGDKDEGSNKLGAKSGKSKKDYGSYDQDNVPSDDDDEKPAPRSAKSEKPAGKPAQKTEKRASLSDDDDEEAAPAPKAGKRQLPIDDDDEEGPSRTYAAADDDDEPEEDDE